MSQEHVYEHGLSAQSSHSPSHQEQSKKIKEFQLDFFIEKKYISQDELKNILEETKNHYNIKNIEMNQNNQIPGLDGTAFSIIDFDDNKLNAKCDAAHKILATIEQKKNVTLDIIMLIPEGTVSYLIGTSGKQIKNIMLETKANVVVNYPINGFQLRTVKITGESSRIFNAIKLITKKLQERGVTQDDYIKKAEPLDPKRVIIKAKFIFSKTIIDFALKSRDREKKSQVKYKIKGGDEIQLKNKLKKDEGILQIVGSLINVQEAIQNIIKKVTQEFRKTEFDIRIVMPANLASKIIGAKGCQIRELANKSKGAQIKVLSDKDDPDAGQDCLVQISGSMENKQQATIQLLEQIECFKHGGPILESGKYINENFAQQYKNQVHAQQAGKNNRKYSSSSISSWRSRSRSSSQRRHRTNKKSRSPSSNRLQSKQKKIKTKIVVPIKLIQEQEKQLIKLGNHYKVHIEPSESESRNQAIVTIRGDIKDCLEVISNILNEQQKLQSLRK